MFILFTIHKNVCAVQLACEKYLCDFDNSKHYEHFFEQMHNILTLPQNTFHMIITIQSKMVVAYFFLFFCFVLYCYCGGYIFPLYLFLQQWYVYRLKLLFFVFVIFYWDVNIENLQRLVWINSIEKYYKIEIYWFQIVMKSLTQRYVKHLKMCIYW